MSKELPYFKFNVSEWILGRISDQSDRVQGAFIVAICYYWHNKCDCFVEDFKRKIGKKRFDLLHFNKFISIKNEKVCIDFLDEQFKELSEIQAKRVKGGLARAKQVLQHNTQHNGSYIDKEEDKEEDKEHTHSLYFYIKKNFPNVYKLKEQLTDEQAKTLVETYKKEEIKNVLDAMENKVDLTKKYRSVYRTMNNWLKLRQPPKPIVVLNEPNKT